MAVKLADRFAVKVGAPAPIPEQTRNSQPNPYSDLMPKLVQLSELPEPQGVTLTITAKDGLAETLEKAVKRSVTWLRNAATEVDKTARTLVTIEDGKAAEILVWLVARQERPRKDAK